ncbi:DNA-deoxyinosine glycosylase [Methanoplanus limicola]|uniref:G/U mismatch-specific uracil-DNA glycosylase n=1 Tax=Methanoplanus limicola DSM 2279 TaxID=937775 RepID=H1YYA7_9EURY|nr:DNA-deoxyinosine glycosylase [Methanoplanus limicola]EHQ34202.1 G/U mismatch-specific uracil-DNA glycosylase [Methanoplanus limicola DSM 2279]
MASDNSAPVCNTIHSGGLAPVSGSDPLILILGSYPGDVSLQVCEYYGNRRNHFWKLMEEILGIDSSLSYDERIKAIISERIALWDVLYGCSREKSSDSRISSAVPNNISGFLEENPSVKYIALNGKTGAGRWFYRTQKDILSRDDLTVRILPSTSPANALFSFEDKLDEWRIVGNWLKRV